MPKGFCDNGGTAVIGPYCSVCGQHAHASARAQGALRIDHGLPRRTTRWRRLPLGSAYCRCPLLTVAGTFVVSATRT